MYSGRLRSAVRIPLRRWACERQTHYWLPAGTPSVRQKDRRYHEHRRGLWGSRPPHALTLPRRPPGFKTVGRPVGRSLRDRPMGKGERKSRWKGGAPLTVPRGIEYILGI